VIRTYFFDEFLQVVRTIRFSPTKSWKDYVGINAIIVNVLAPYLVSGNLDGSMRSEMREFYSEEMIKRIREYVDQIQVAEIDDLNFEDNQEELMEQYHCIRRLRPGT